MRIKFLNSTVTVFFTLKKLHGLTKYLGALTCYTQVEQIGDLTEIQTCSITQGNSFLNAWKQLTTSV